MTPTEQAGADALPFPDASFDVLTARHMLYHVPSVPAALAEFRRVLKPGGRFLATTNVAAYMPELFGTRTRYSGASLGCQVSAALSGGFAPLIAAGLLAWAGATWPISLYLIALAAITLAAVLASRETANLDITRG